MIYFAIFTFLATMLGGILALRLKDRLHLILGVSAGMVFAAGFLDLLPESIKLLGDTDKAFFFALLGFFFYMIMDRFFSLHAHHEEGEHIHRGGLRAVTLSFHSLIDGLTIGYAFLLSPLLGIPIGIAVVAHDMSDGINTVVAVMKNGNKEMIKKAKKWLLIDAIAPVLGIILSTIFVISENSVGYVLAIVSGFFIYISASDLIPESYHHHPKFWTSFSTILGVIFMCIILQFAK